jgi:hypothetical protein
MDWRRLEIHGLTETEGKHQEELDPGPQMTMSRSGCSPFSLCLFM